MTIEGSTRPKLKRKARLRFDERAGKHLLLYPERGLLLDEIGTAICRLCDGSRTVDAMVAELAERFRGETARIRSELIAFLQQLDERTLLETAT
jgi:pyrroloquinoline quinone biosynthesis protein D